MALKGLLSDRGMCWLWSPQAQQHGLKQPNSRVETQVHSSDFCWKKKVECTYHTYMEFPI